MGRHIIDLDREFYPAHTFPDPLIDDHHPVLLSLRTAENPLPGAVKQRSQIRVKGLTKEEWDKKNTGMQEFLYIDSSKLQSCIQTCNLARFFDIMMDGLLGVCTANYRRKKRGGCNTNAPSDQKPQVAPSSPFRNFCRGLKNIRNIRY